MSCLEQPGVGAANGFVISKKHRLVATAAHVAGLAYKGSGRMMAHVLGAKGPIPGLRGVRAFGASRCQPLFLVFGRSVIYRTLAKSRSESGYKISGDGRTVAIFWPVTLPAECTFEPPRHRVGGHGRCRPT